MRRIVLAVACGLAVGLWPGGVSAAEEPCEQPYLPVAQGATYSGSPGVAVGLPYEEDLNYGLQRARTPPDTDGDGSPDQVIDGRRTTTGTPPSSLTIRRSDGDVVLQSAGDADLVDALRWGDYDGDGRDDVIASVNHRAIVDDRQFDYYAVNGTLPPGEYDVADAGVRVIPPDLNAPFLWFWVGDLNDDGGEDVVVYQDVLSGRALLTPGPGATLDYPSAVLDHVVGPSGYAAFLALDDRPRATVVQGHVAGDEVILDVGTVPAIELRTGPSGAMLKYASIISGFRAGGHRIIEIDGGDRSGGYIWLWDLDDPCRRVAAHAVTSAPPAPGGDGSALPRTGLDAADLAGSGVVLIGLGAVLKRRTREASRH